MNFQKPELSVSGFGLYLFFFGNSIQSMFGFGYGPRKNPVFEPLILSLILSYFFFVFKSVSNKQVLEQEKFLLIKVLKKRLFCFEHVLAF